MMLTDVIRRPLITEKTSILREDGKTIVFHVAADANKIEIRRAIEHLLGAKVASVRTVIAHGKGAHAGNAHKEGANALWALAKLIDRAQGLTDYARGITVNVGKVTGGTSKNTVPDRAEALIDFRFETRADGESLLAALRKAAEESAASVQGTRIEIEGGIARLPLERTDASVRLMESYGEAAALAGLGHGEAALIGGGSDASTAHAMGIAAIDGLGPRGIGFHTKDEQIEIVTLVQKAKALARFLASLRA